MIRIDPEFQTLIPPLTEEEFSGLKENILSEGVRDPLVVWRNENLTLLDGHNRYRICNENDIHFNILERTFKDREEAKTWIIKNQFGRRNLNNYQRSILALQLEDIFKKKAKENQGLRTDIPQNSAKSYSSIETREELAKQASVSHDTIAKVKVIEERASGEQKEKLRSGDRSINSVYNAISRKENRNTESPKLPEGIFNIIYADPPWAYNNSGFKGSAIKKYPVMDTDKICALPVEDRVADNSVLFLWVTNPFLKDGLRVAESWGFEYKTNFSWIKNRGYAGFYNRGKHELLFVCVRGSCLPNGKLLDSVLEANVTEHSRKPKIHSLIELMYPNGKYLEMFAREADRKNWTFWGNEVED